MTQKEDARTPQAKSFELLVAITGKASPAKSAEGDKPVFAYIESLPEPQKSIAKRIDALAAKALPSTRDEQNLDFLYLFYRFTFHLTKPALR